MILHRYEILEKIGTGVCCDVYKAKTRCVELICGIGRIEADQREC